MNCANYRDQLDTDNTDVVTIVAFGTSDDLFALAALYSTAEMLALRLLPRGDRRFRTSWWRGFTEGVESKLSQERATIVTESPGTGLVLVERATRADHVMRSSTPHLRNSYSSYASDGDAYLAGHAAGSQFNGANNAVRGGTRAIGPAGNG